MAERYDYDAIAEDDALLDLLAAGGDAAVELRGAGDDPAIQLLAELRLAVEEVDERPAQVLIDADDFLDRVAARNSVINEELARKIATRGLALSVAAVAALSVSGVAAAVNGDPLAPYEKVISRVVDAVRPQTSYPANRIDGLVIGDGRLSKVQKADLNLRQSERDAQANEDADLTVSDQLTVLGVPVQRPMARSQPPFVLPPEKPADVKITTATDNVLPPASTNEPKAAATADPPPAPADPGPTDPTGTVAPPPSSPTTDPPVTPPGNTTPPSDTGTSGNDNNAAGNTNNGTPATTDATPDSGTGAPATGTLEDQSGQSASEDSDGATANPGDGHDPADESGSGGAAHDDDGAPVTAPVTDTATPPAQAATDGGAQGGGTENAQSVTKSAKPGSKADTKAETKTDAKTAKAKAGSKAKVKATAKAHRGAKALWAAKRAHAHGHAVRALALRHGARAVTAHSRHGHGEVRRLPNISDMRLLAAVTSAALGDGDSQD